ncbi:MAG: GNAT family N-acetyltransferase [Paraglaciecola sp.]|nr:GNAT family N-acetyltransferase [Paraglaciecola sp.]
MGRIRQATEEDAKGIAEIYNEYVLNSVVTFEEQIVEPSIMASRIKAIQALGLPWLVAVDECLNIIGYAYASQWKTRSAYAQSVEITVYLTEECQSKGWGSNLYQRLFTLLKAKGVHVVIAGIALPNPASIALHKKFNMKKVGHFEQVGRKFNRWIDVAYWQGILT